MQIASLKMISKTHNLSFSECCQFTTVFFVRYSTRLRGSIIGWRHGWPLMQCPLLVRVGICNLFMGPAIACLLFVKDIVGSLTFTNECWQMGFPFNVHRRDGTHIDESPFLWNTAMTVYSWVKIQTPDRQLRGECVIGRNHDRSHVLGHLASPQLQWCECKKVSDKEGAIGDYNPHLAWQYRWRIMANVILIIDPKPRHHIDQNQC